MFRFPFRGKFGASSSDDGKDGADQMGRGECRPSSRGVGANFDEGQYSGRGGKRQGANKAEEGVDVFCAPSCKKIGASSSDNGDDGAKRMWRGDSRPSSRGGGANRDGGNAVEEEGSDRERTNQTRASMCFVSPFAKNLERHHQTMARMKPK